MVLLRLLYLCSRIRRQVSGIVISKTMYQDMESNYYVYLMKGNFKCLKQNFIN